MSKSRILLLIAVIFGVAVTAASFAWLGTVGDSATGPVGPFKAELIYERGREYLDEAEIGKAENAFLIIISKYPSSHYAERSLRHMASIYSKSKDYDKAAYYYRRLLKAFPHVADAGEIKKTIDELNMKHMASGLRTEDSVEYVVQPGDSLYAIAKKFNTTVPLIKKLNGLESDLIRVGQKLKLNVAKFSILVDKARNELILKKDGEPFKSYTVATGKNNSTPEGEFLIVDKMIEPAWTKPGVGVILPGDERYELGARWMPISKPGYGIHGTNDESTIGKQCTSGCVRMRNADVVELYEIVPKGTEVVIIDSAKKEKDAGGGSSVEGPVTASEIPNKTER
ncbi:MAG: L,D-transpeptidase family protein [Candidatus Omnitrophica bacterium]|nr:L,D-transpeptidase family protein [Candidatus Omnitrophota bacterium]